MTTPPHVWTVGHSTHTIEQMVSSLTSFSISLLIDVRSFPGSRRFPQFNRENLNTSLPTAGIRYSHMPELGGRRRPARESTNVAWRNASFRGYADYMETSYFKNGIEKLEELASRFRTVYMCSEAVWWRCHRALISDYLKSIGVGVTHILDASRSEPHPYTSVARIVDGKLFY